jgi:hypothetical protein
MKAGNMRYRLTTFFTTLVILLLFSMPVFAIDDGARAYWKTRDGAQGVSFQFLSMDLQASDSLQFAPGQYIYPGADTEASLVIANYLRHTTLFNRPSSFSFSLVGGSVDLDVKASVASELVPPGVTDPSFSESASGYADPSMQLVVNLFGAPPLKANFDLLDYEPTWTLDVATMLALPVGEYDEDRLVNLGQNRWFGRVALPFKYHFGAFTPGYRSSLELTPSVWLFDDNDDFLGQTLKNDPLLQLEAHLTNDFTPNFFGSLDLLYRGGFQSEIDGVEVGEELDIGNLGFTLSYQATDNLSIRTGFSSNVFGDEDLDSSMARIQFVFGWHPDFENIKKLQQGH